MTPIKRKAPLSNVTSIKKAKKEVPPEVKSEESATDSNGEDSDTISWTSEDKTGGESYWDDEGPLDDSKIAETAFDSDPIVESDTASSSGAEGFSWPSDEEQDTEGQFEGLPNSGEDEEEDGGVEIVAAKERAKKDKKLGAQDGGLSSSREAHAKQKETAKERKAAKPNADSIARTKQLWERLRRKSHVPIAERNKLVAELFEIISGHVHDFVFKHDSVRVVQTAVKYGKPEQRRMIAQELKGGFRSLTESKYAKFLVGKLLSYGDDEIRDMVVPEFYGHVRQMIKHPEAAWILDDVYRGACKADQKAALLREWYGPEFAIFRTREDQSPTADLETLLGQNPEKRKPIMHYLRELINLLIQKKTAAFTLLHDAMLQYYFNLQSGSEEAAEFIELLKGDEEGDLLKNLAFTKPGARLVCLALSYGNAKDRKYILRSYRNTIQMMAYDNHAHQILLTAFDVIDDTVLTIKTILPELLGGDNSMELKTQDVLSAINHVNARIPLLYLFAGSSRGIIPKPSLKLIDEVHAIRKTSSKKDPDTRRSELLKAMSPPLLRLIAGSAADIVTTSYGCQFVSEVLLARSQPDLEARKIAAAAIVELLNSPEARAALKEPSARRMLRNLTQGGHFNPTTKMVYQLDPPLNFDEMLYKAIEDDIVEWAVSENSFVVVAMMESKDFKNKADLKKKLKAGKRRIKDASKDRLDASTDIEGGGKAKKALGGRGNAGAKILIQGLNE